MRYLIYQMETCPKTQRDHWQGYLELFDQTSLKDVSALFEGKAPHLEQRRGTRKQAMDYCRKGVTAIEGTLTEFGKVDTKQGARGDLAAFTADIKTGMSDAKLCEKHPGAMFLHGAKVDRFRSQIKNDIPPGSKRTWETKGTWLWGPSGAGKSHKARELGGDAAYWKPIGKYWDGYAGESTVILEELTVGDVPRTVMCKLVDKYPLLVNAKGIAHVPFLARHVIVTSNDHPRVVMGDTWWSTIERRFDIVEFGLTDVEKAAEARQQTALADQFFEALGLGI